MANNEVTGLFPMFVDISNKRTVVFGAGRIALRRINTLTAFCENITVIAPEACEEVLSLAREGRITYKEGRYQREDIYQADLVLAATDDSCVNNDIYSACKCLGIMVNVCSDRTKCDFHFPGIVKEGDLVIGVNAGGKDHKLAKKMRESIEEAFRKGDLI